MSTEIILSPTAGRPMKALVPASRLILIQSSASACTRSRGTTPRPAGSTCRTTAAGQIGRGLVDRGRTSVYCAATTTATRGDRLPKDCRRTSDFPSWFTRTMPTRYTSCPLSRRRAPVLAARLRCGVARVAASRGAGSCGDCRKRSYFTVLRDAMDIDRLKAPALYFGTTTGQLWIGREGGEQWDCLFDSLPPIHNVKVAVV
jgi:hypothetical protein